MNSLLIGIIPLIAFAILDSYANLNVALLITLLLTIAEVVYTLLTLGTLDSVSILSISLVFILVGLSYKKKNRVIFKLKPAILNGFMGLYMIIFHFLNRPILIEIFKKYPQLIPSESRSIFLTNHGQILLKNLSFTLGVALILHGIIVGYSGVKHNNFWWTVVNIVGLLIAIIMASLCAIII